MCDRRPETLTQSDLNQFTGSENLYRHFTGLKYTDGVQYLATTANCFWLLDVIGSYQNDKRVRDNQRLSEFQLWRLDVVEQRGVVMLFEDSGLPAVLSQEIEFTDFPLESLKLYVEAGVILLPSEH